MTSVKRKRGSSPTRNQVVTPQQNKEWQIASYGFVKMVLDSIHIEISKPSNVPLRVISNKRIGKIYNDLDDIEYTNSIGNVAWVFYKIAKGKKMPTSHAFNMHGANAITDADIENYAKSFYTEGGAKSNIFQADPSATYVHLVTQDASTYATYISGKTTIHKSGSHWLPEVLNPGEEITVNTKAVDGKDTMTIKNGDRGDIILAMLFAKAVAKAILAFGLNFGNNAMVSAFNNTFGSMALFKERYEYCLYKLCPRPEIAPKSTTVHLFAGMECAPELRNVIREGMGIAIDAIDVANTRVDGTKALNSFINKLNVPSDIADLLRSKYKKNRTEILDNLPLILNYCNIKLPNERYRFAIPAMLFMTLTGFGGIDGSSVGGFRAYHMMIAARKLVAYRPAAIVQLASFLAYTGYYYSDLRLVSICQTGTAPSSSSQLNQRKVFGSSALWSKERIDVNWSSWEVFSKSRRVNTDLQSTGQLNVQDNFAGKHTRARNHMDSASLIETTDPIEWMKKVIVQHLLPDTDPKSKPVELIVGTQHWIKKDEILKNPTITDIKGFTPYTVSGLDRNPVPFFANTDPTSNASELSI